MAESGKAAKGKPALFIIMGFIIPYNHYTTLSLVLNLYITSLRVSFLNAQASDEGRSLMLVRFPTGPLKLRPCR
jgi:hypothetical protein